MSGARGTLLIIEDSPDTAELLSTVVEEEGFAGSVSATAEAALRSFAASRPVGVFVDWVLPDLPGLDVTRRLRQADPLIPIIIISGRDDEASMTRGLDAGADDYLVKPIRRTELIARLEAHLRKAAAARELAGAEPALQPAAAAPVLFSYGAIELDPAARIVTVSGQEIGLGPLEFRLLEYFCRNAGIAVSREQILNEVYGYEADISTERVDLLVRRLRAKLGEGTDRGNQLVAVPGYGYRLERRSSERRLRPGRERAGGLR